MEVDASDLGVRAVLSQRAQTDNKLHPCAFLSKRLSSVERNYDVGNRELLAAKVALEIWHHWLEGAKHPFLVWTDHKNLEYIRSAKRLNPRQARWVLFFNRFDFSLSYRPGSKNVKPDSLARLFEPDSSPKSPVKSCLHPAWSGRSCGQSRRRSGKLILISLCLTVALRIGCLCLSFCAHR